MTAADPHVERRRTTAINDTAAAAGQLRLALEAQVAATRDPATLARTAGLVLDRAAHLFPDPIERRAFLNRHLDLGRARRQLVEALAVLDSIERLVDEVSP